MVDLKTSFKIRARPPPAADLVKSFKIFFSAKQQSREPLQEVQASHAALTFKHLKDTNKEEEGFGLTLEDLQVALEALNHLPKDDTTTHNKLARSLFAEINSRKEADPSIDGSVGPEDISPYTDILSMTGDTLEARNVIEEFWKTTSGGNGTNNGLILQGKAARNLWTHVLKGFAKEENDGELLRTITVMRDLNVPFDAKLHEAMTTFYARRDDIEGTKKWFRYPLDGETAPTARTNAVVLKFCLRNNEMEWGSNIFRSILETNPLKSTWDVIFLWAAGMGKGVDEIDRMMDVMTRRNKDNESVRPDVDTINGLVEFANSKNDPYNAERYVTLGQKWNILPNARTYILQMEYRIRVGDFDGVKVAYTNLQGQEILHNEDLPVINKLVQALCSSKSVDYDGVMAIVEDLNERNARLEPETVSALCRLHLQREEMHEIIDLLQSHTFHYSIHQRAMVRDVFVGFCLDRKVSTARAWDAYMIFRQVFDETPIEIRTRMMREFFQRNRPDMACHVFGHMRQHHRQEWRPTTDTYIQCFEGIAGAADLESLEMVHNMLKLDFTIEPNTRMYNALMLGYTACEMPFRSLQYWEDINNSREGPTYNSIRIAFRACEAAPFGDKQARTIWQLLKRMDIEVTPEVFAAYVGALAGQGLLAEVRELIGGMEKEVGSKPDALTLGTFYNATPGDNKKEEVEKWGSTTYPTAWGNLVELGQRTLRDGTRVFKINRDVAA
ncbi:MAG: hypothetical protein M1827_004604 [Pycnora praestabilis]|nr:MAG: hypothetical protein M1827_004604 [Pycnora praestabilis]